MEVVQNIFHQGAPSASDVDSVEHVPQQLRYVNLFSVAEHACTPFGTLDDFTRQRFYGIASGLRGPKCCASGNWQRG